MKELKSNNTRSNDLNFLESWNELEAFISHQKNGSFHFTNQFSDKRVLVCGIIDWQETPPVFKAIKFSSENLTANEETMLDSLIELVLDQGFARLNNLSIREIDSFLRIDHLSSAFSCSLNSLFPVFTKVKESLLSQIDETPVFDPKNKRSPVLSLDYKPNDVLEIELGPNKAYTDLSTNERQSVVEQIFDKHVRPALLRDGGGAQIVFCDEFLIVIQYLGHCEFCQYSLTTTLDYIQRVLQLETQHSGLRIITDS